MKMNEKYSKSMSRDYHFAVVDKLEKEIESLKVQLQRESDVVDFYAKAESYSIIKGFIAEYQQRIKNDSESEFEMNGCMLGEGSMTLFIGGKLARSAQSLREKK